MPSTRFLTTAASLVTAAAATVTLTTGAVASAATSTAGAPAARIAPAASTGSYTNWFRAQRAAGFGLVRPRTTYGLRMNGRILVDRCMVSGHFRSKVVDVQYGSFTRHAVGLEQNNAGVNCTISAGGAYLGTYRVAGVKAVLRGYCGHGTPYSCRSVRIELWLSWRKGRNFYIASSFNEPRARLLYFARTLRRV